MSPGRQCGGGFYRELSRRSEIRSAHEKEQLLKFQMVGWRGLGQPPCSVFRSAATSLRCLSLSPPPRRLKNQRKAVVTAVDKKVPNGILEEQGEVAFLFIQFIRLSDCVSRWGEEVRESLSAQAAGGVKVATGLRGDVQVVPPLRSCCTSCGSSEQQK